MGTPTPAQPTPSATPAVESTPEATSTGSPTPTPSPMPTPTPTAAPTATITSQPVTSLPAEVVTDNLNVRLGPALGYPVRGQLSSGDVVEAIALSKDGEWLALDGLGWVSRDDDWVEVDGDAEQLPGQTAAYYALVGPSYHEDVRTGFREVDVVIEAVHGGDLDALAGMLRVYSDVCPREGPNLPPSCPESGDDGPIDVVFSASCEGAYVLASERRAVVDGWYTNRRSGEPRRVAANPPRLYAVTQLEDGRRVVVFAFANGIGAIAFVYPDGSVDLPANVCELYPPNLLVHSTPLRPAPELLLPPTAPPPLDILRRIELPLDTRTGNPPTDTVLDALVDGDAAAVIELVTFETVPCRGAGGGFPSGPNCKEGEAERMPVEAFLLFGNEGSYLRPEELESAFERWSASISSGELWLCELKPGQILFGSVEVNERGVGVELIVGISIEDSRITSATSLSDAITLRLARCAADVRLEAP